MTRRKVLLLTGAIALVWMVIVMLTPSPSTSTESEQRLNRYEDPLVAGGGKFRAPYPAREAVKQNVDGRLKEYGDFDAFLLQDGGGARNYNAKNESRILKLLNDTDSTDLLDLELDLIPKKSLTIDTSALWETAASWVTSKQITPDSTTELGDVLHALSTSAIVKADVGYKGTQLKATLVLEGGQLVVFKPGR